MPLKWQKSKGKQVYSNFLRFVSGQKPSWPGLSRPSRLVVQTGPDDVAACFENPDSALRTEIVNGRDKPGRDVFGVRSD
jgi:hypothetical protein